MILLHFESEWAGTLVFIAVCMRFNFIVKLFSDSDTALEKRAKELIAEMASAEKGDESAATKSKRKSKKAKVDGQASDQQVARALGGKVPVRPELQESKNNTEKAKKEAKASKRKAADSLDLDIISIGSEYFTSN